MFGELHPARQVVRHRPMGADVRITPQRRADESLERSDVFVGIRPQRLAHARRLQPQRQPEPRIEELVHRAIGKQNVRRGNDLAASRTWHPDVGMRRRPTESTSAGDASQARSAVPGAAGRHRTHPAHAAAFERATWTADPRRPIVPALDDRSCSAPWTHHEDLGREPIGFTPVIDEPRRQRRRSRPPRHAYGRAAIARGVSVPSNTWAAGPRMNTVA